MLQWRECKAMPVSHLLAFPGPQPHRKKGNVSQTVLGHGHGHITMNDSRHVSVSKHLKSFMFCSRCQTFNHGQSLDVWSTDSVTQALAKWWQMEEKSLCSCFVCRNFSHQHYPREHGIFGWSRKDVAYRMYAEVLKCSGEVWLVLWQFHAKNLHYCEALSLTSTGGNFIFKAFVIVLAWIYLRMRYVTLEVSADRNVKHIIRAWGCSVGVQYSEIIRKAGQEPEVLMALVTCWM